MIRLVELQGRLLTKKERAPLNGQPVEPPAERILRLPEVLRRTGLCKKTIYRLEETGCFPARRKLGLRAVGWPESHVEAWIADPEGWQRNREGESNERPKSG